MVVPQTQISYGYERNPNDPRISQELVLKTDALGIPLETASIIYPRLATPANPLPWMVREEQAKLHIVLREMTLTADIDDDHAYRLRAAYEEKAYELLQASLPVGETYFTPTSLKNIVDTAAVLDYIQEPTDPSIAYKRLHGHTKVQLLKDDLSEPEQIGELTALGIPYKTYQLAYTPLQLNGDANRSLNSLFTTANGTDLLSSIPSMNDLGYVDVDGDGDWWLHSGTTLYDNSLDTNNLPTASNATENFYLPYGVEDILGNQSTMQYDAYQLLPLSVTDVLGNTSSAVYDYRVLQPVLLTDINDNQSAVEFDVLGIVVKSAIMGKTNGSGQVEGDTLDHPTAIMEYDFYNYKDNGEPNYIHSKVREQHYDPDVTAVWQESYEYSSGMGEVIMAKVQTKPGEALEWDDSIGEVVTVNASERWIGNGRTIINNKGLPIKQYEPYFSATHKYESAAELVEIGYSPTLYYDAAGRNNYTELADGTIVRTEFDSWFSKQYDSNDTILESPLYDKLSASDKAEVSGTAVPTNLRLKALWQAAQHANTPTTVHTDCLGRAIFASEELTAGTTYASVYTQTDMAGRESRIYDQLATAELLQNTAGDYSIARGISSYARTNLLGQAVYSWTAVKGATYQLTDALGRMVRIWDNPDDATNRLEYSTDYDVAHRPLKTYVQKGASARVCFAKTEYGQSLKGGFTDPKANNLLGQAYKSYDQSGVITTEEIDFKGNPLRMSRQMTERFDQFIDWNNSVALERDIFETVSSYDALNRPIETTLPDNSILRPTYNTGGYMEELAVDVLGLGNFVTYLRGQDFDAKGQQQRLQLGNGTITKFFYEAATFRLSNLLTENGSDKLQDLHYTYDPVGNAINIKDDAQSSYYYNNQAIAPRKTYRYDALYRLIEATGRQHAGAGAPQANSNPQYAAPLPHNNIQSAVSSYKQEYHYDEVGNITQLHQFNAWTRNYEYENNATNQLVVTRLSTNSNLPITYSYDHHGNMKALPHLQALHWNHQDELVRVELDLNDNVAHYNYDGGGQRSRKVITHDGNKKKERLYLGGVERYREYDNNGAVELERWTLQVEGLAQVDTLTVKNSAVVATPLPVARYQYRDRLGSSVH